MSEKPRETDPTAQPLAAAQQDRCKRSGASACSAIWVRGMIRCRYVLTQKLADISSMLERDIRAREEIKTQIAAIDEQMAMFSRPLIQLPLNAELSDRHE